MFKGTKHAAILLTLTIALCCCGSAGAAGSIPSFLSFCEGRGTLINSSENTETSTVTYQVTGNDAAAWQAEIERAGYERNGLWLFNTDDGDILLVAAYRDRTSEDPASFLMNVMGDYVRCHLLAQTDFKPNGEVWLVLTHSRGISFHDRNRAPMPAPKMVQIAENVETYRTCSMSLWHSSLPGGARDCSVCHGTNTEKHVEVVYSWVEAEGSWEEQAVTETHDCWVCEGKGSRAGFGQCPLCRGTGNYTVNSFRWVWKPKGPHF